MRSFVLVVLVAGCSFSGGKSAPDASAIDAPGSPDAPPQTPAVRFVSVDFVNAAPLRPGTYGLEVQAIIENGLDVEITDLEVDLSFISSTDGAEQTKNFRWRDVDAREDVMQRQATTIAAGESLVYRFTVDALASAVGDGPIALNGVAVFQENDAPMSVTPLPAPTLVPFDLPNPAIVVTTAIDEMDNNGETSFREALQIANITTGLDRIVFEEGAFPIGTVVLLDENLGELPTIVNGDLVIDGNGANVELSVDSNWETPTGRYGLQIDGPKVVISSLAFRDMAYNYIELDLSGDSCGGEDAIADGGAIQVINGTLILDGNTFSDPSVNKRNCFAASVRLFAGSKHRVLNNRFIEPVMDHLAVASPTIEISDNLFIGGSTPSESDDGFFIAAQAADIWVTGNIVVDHDRIGFLIGGGGAGTVYALHNTFVRNGETAILRRTDQGMVTLRNNVYVDHVPEALTFADGSGFDIDFELVKAGVLCSDCSGASVGVSNLTADPMLVNEAGSRRQDLSPAPGSPLIDSADGWLDRNGRRPGRSNGDGPDRGAVEIL